MSGDTAIATVCLSGTLEDKLAAAAAAGFHGVEIFENDLIASRRTPSEIRRLCADLGLTIDLYQPFRDFEAVPPDVLRANLRRARRKFDLMAELGADTVLVCSSVSPDAVDDDDLAAEQLHELASLAASRGIRVAYEALAWGRFVNTYEHAWRIVRRADHPALGVCLDSFHILSRRSDSRAIRTIPGEKIFFLQLADAPLLDMDVLHWSRHHRLFPGQGAFDLATFTGHVLAAGYRGPLSLEVFNDVFRQADPRPAAVDAMRSLVALRESVGALAVPEAPRLDGHAFAELAVPGAVLAELGFTHVGTHRSKPVHLWRQGSARLLVNEAAAEGTISALGLTSANPAGSARRAEDLLAPVLPREHGPDEADLSAVAAPDGTEIFFCGNEEWLRDFVPTGAAPSGTGITGIDHVALTQPFDHFDEATLFYRSVLGLEPEPVSEFAAPFGLVRSRAVGNRDVRLTLDSALVRRGEWAPGVPSPQHIALACDDAIAVARAMREAGAPLLSIPGNYYDDLDARFDLPFSAALRENSVLYDRDSSGEFLHFCTELVGSRVFFEVVQRIGGYRGYGVVNTPVYMTAHRERRLSLTR
ncbi:sugar phosphate isomerase/epimerase and 4-hydroxyphenylpyruvate domain-containing protein [Amycolatopsis roodepoortensis]|uniref:bifunctional sugar phosphate isomerase/epimerase/4-hydroxyphenylpyruvate dioxygenase family protein n=1 Tax=Amycolatopsis roodepoortensis TaxID=700274 RepID=UPI00214C0803|nr:sugar phosphate isomerase/epimerase and 4-hydroxyphenylpyruvate domain-containing protein [Amycolatopsis roodepoortensis]UUV32805.1 sugar phosphate isomerase/epimerase and 4-hydroxyphenylpyruvate domain-containing protein [Amycolatopsis roodepoortensis]